MIDLLELVEYGGCSAKLPAKELDKLLSNFPILKNENVMVDNSLHDDAGVYRIAEDLALIFTTDFFPPVCSDPYTFGRIAATNSLSDVYAMGGRPIMALNINMYPATLPIDGLAEILRGGNDVAISAGTTILGGHTIEDKVPKYGLAVVGVVNPNGIVRNSGLKEGQTLILTKPIGVGAILAAQRAGMASKEQVEAALQSMSTLNDKACEILLKYKPTGGTDITGFGLGGHLLRMAQASNVSVELTFNNIPLFDGILQLYQEGCIPGASFRNKEFVGANIGFSDRLTYEQKMVLFDAQTSGGLLFGVDSACAEIAVKELLGGGIPAAAIGVVNAASGIGVYVK